MVEASWQGRALGVLQSAGSTARLLGPLLAGWLLTFDLRKPISQYGYTPFLAGAFLCLIGAAFAFCFKKPADNRSPDNVAVGV
jgi:MFS family permease